MITLALPYPPTVNTYWRRNGGQYYISGPGKAYRSAVMAAALQQRVKPLAGRLAVRVRLIPPDRRRRDIDNVLKALLDSLAHAKVYEDDSQIDQLSIERDAPSKAGGQALVQVQQIDTEDDLERWRRFA